jgi:hypothetical protein
MLVHRCDLTSSDSHTDSSYSRALIEQNDSLITACDALLFCARSRENMDRVEQRKSLSPSNISNDDAGARGANIRVILWNDVFVVVDNGSGRQRDYKVLHELVTQRTRHVTRGLGCLAIIPSGATPPAPDVRAALDATLQAIPLRCICWLVEGQGFHSAMVRAVITGLRFLKYQKYPTHVASSLEDALAWMLPLLQGGAARLTELRSGAAYIRSQRESSRYAHSL